MTADHYKASRLEMWQHYLSWIDRDLGNGWPRLNGLSSLVPFIPLMFGVAYSAWFHPDERPGTVESAIVLVPMVTLAAIWAWRAGRCAVRQYRIIKSQQPYD
ncbi:MAG: hypothetical protein WBL20_13020 [Sphingobium sp.]|uniref:hypothetical protein n=1 Tax=Sphingobium sp. TaxID=1912891 RepID=UPI003BAEF4FA